MSKKLGPARHKLPGLAFVFIGLLAVVPEDALADIALFTLSTDRAYALSQQEVSVEVTDDVLTLGIEWKRTSPLIFGRDFSDRYVSFFKALVSEWDAHAEYLDATGGNTAPLGYLPTQGGELSVHFFSRLANGQEFVDGQSRVRVVYCGEVDRDCIAGQVHFYSREQVFKLVGLISAL